MSDTYLIESYEQSLSDEIAYMESAAKVSYHLKETLVPIVHKVLQSPKNRNAIIEFTGKFIDTNSEQLYAPGPIYSFLFGKNEFEPIYALFGLSEDIMKNECKEVSMKAYDGQLNMEIIKAGPHKLLIALLVAECIKEGYEDLLTACKYMLGFAEYPILLRKSFPTGVQPTVMIYTIEHLPQKFKIKKMANLLELLYYDMNGVVNLCKDRVTTEMDYQYMDFLYRARNQLKATIKKIAKVYFDNIQNNGTLVAQSGIDANGNVTNVDGQYSNTSAVIDKIYAKMQANFIHKAFVKFNAEANSINKDLLETYLNKIYSDPNNKLHKFIENVVIGYFRKTGNTEIISGEFISYGLALYRSIASSKDELYIELRTIVNYWMNDIIHITDSYSNKGTIINYTRGVFNYMIWMMNYYK